MAIRVQHSPNLASYGTAMQQASRNVTANNRLEKYASYLHGVQKANQDYGLGLGRLNLDTKAQADDLALNQYRAQLDAQRQSAEIQHWGKQAQADLIRAYADRQRANAGTLRLMI